MEPEIRKPLDSNLPEPQALDATVVVAARHAPCSEPSQASSPHRSPRQKHSYDLNDFTNDGNPLGSGSYGVVQRVKHKTTGELYAMKVIPKKKVREHNMTEYLYREVKIQAKLRHPNVLRLHFYFEDAEKVYLLLEYASAGALFSVLRKRRRLPEREAAPVFLDVTKGLQHLHQNGIVHRDLKPENILMCDGMVAKLADFGWCAEIKKDGGGRNTFCGTMDYLSPEMVNNQPHDHTVDVWSLGVLLFEMLVGRAPFTSANQMKAMALIMTAELEVPDFISAAARDLMRRLIVKEREKRLSLQATIEHQWVTSNTSAADDISAAALEAAASHAVHREVTTAIELDNKRMLLPEASDGLALPESTLVAGELDSIDVTAPVVVQSNKAPAPTSLDATRIIPPQQDALTTAPHLQVSSHDPPMPPAATAVGTANPAQAQSIPSGVPGLDVTIGATVRSFTQNVRIPPKESPKAWEGVRNGLGTDVVAGAVPQQHSGPAGALAPPTAAGLRGISSNDPCGSSLGTRSRQVVWALHEPELVTPPQVQREPVLDGCRSRSVSPPAAGRSGLASLLEEEDDTVRVPDAVASLSTAASIGSATEELTANIKKFFTAKKLSTFAAPGQRPYMAREDVFDKPSLVDESWRLPGDGVVPSPSKAGTRSHSCSAKYHSGDGWRASDDWSPIKQASEEQQMMQRTFTGDVSLASAEDFYGTPLNSASVDTRPKAARPKRRVDRRCPAPSSQHGSREVPTVQLEY